MLLLLLLFACSLICCVWCCLCCCWLFTLSVVVVCFLAIYICGCRSCLKHFNVVVCYGCFRCVLNCVVVSCCLVRSCFGSVPLCVCLCLSVVVFEWFGVCGRVLCFCLLCVFVCVVCVVACSCLWYVLLFCCSYMFALFVVVVGLFVLLCFGVCVLVFLGLC